MGRVYGEPVEVQTRGDGRPTRFVWRGRLYTVRSILERWVISREWWREPDPSPAQPEQTEQTEQAEQPEQTQAEQPEQTEQLEQLELEFWRVEASAGQGFPIGTYELRRDLAAGTWTLRRVVD